MRKLTILTIIILLLPTVSFAGTSCKKIGFDTYCMTTILVPDKVNLKLYVELTENGYQIFNGYAKTLDRVVYHIQGTNIIIIFKDGHPVLYNLMFSFKPRR